MAAAQGRRTPRGYTQLKAAEELERLLAAEIETLEHSEIHQQICDVQERIDKDR